MEKNHPGGAALPAAEKSKAQQRAERRAVQEAQRAAKAAGKPVDHNSAPHPAPARPAESSALPVPKPYQRNHSSPSESSPQATRASQPHQVKPANTKPAQQIVDAKFAQNRQRSFNSDTASVTADVGGAIGKLGIFSHLPIADKGMSLTRSLSFSSNAIHPAVLRLGVQYASGVVSGSNARCVALVHALKQGGHSWFLGAFEVGTSVKVPSILRGYDLFLTAHALKWFLGRSYELWSFVRTVIADYVTPLNKVLCRDLESTIKPYISFLAHCRPLSVSMGNAIRQIKWMISHTPLDMPDTQAKAHLVEQLDHYVEEKIILAGKAISETYANEKITNGDVILTYSCSSLVTKVLMDAHSRGKQFSVVVVDGRPHNEGRELLRRLVRHGIKCSYVHINSISYIMPEVSKILLGAECLLANGYVMSGVGSSQIALVAKAFNVPVLVCCETYKFCERVQTDSIVHNELGNPEDLRVEGLWEPQEEPAMLSRLNLIFDVTPPDMITMVITELGMVPCTSVPVVLRVKHALIK